MARCEVCGTGTDMPYVCNQCGHPYCSQHRLPENHDCVGLENWNDPSGVFDGGDSRSGDTTDRLSVPIDTGAGSIVGYFRGNLTYLFLALMFVTFGLEQLTLFVADEATFRALFVVSPEHPEYVWTWGTSIFAHNPLGFGHIFSNAIIIFFFGRLVERSVGSRNFGLLFLGSGVLGGLLQIAATAAAGGSAGALGASGAALAIMGTLTVLNPKLKVYLYFLLPVPIWLLTGGYTLFTLYAINTGGPGASGVGQIAHLTGLVIGLLYGWYARQQGASGPRRFRLGGGGGRGPGGPGGPRGRNRGPF